MEQYTWTYYAAYKISANDWLLGVQFNIKTKEYITTLWIFNIYLVSIAEFSFRNVFQWHVFDCAGDH